jgi:hypothetical protein
MTPSNSGSLARALRSRRIGRVCWFSHPDDGRIIEGTYRRGRKVVQITAIDRLAELEGHGRGFNIEETVWTIPRGVRIHFGQAPSKGATA